jgi:hypothetical protein
VTKAQREEAAEICNMRGSSFANLGEETVYDALDDYSRDGLALDLACDAYFAVRRPSSFQDAWLEAEVMIREGWVLPEIKIW